MRIKKSIRLILLLLASAHTLAAAATRDYLTLPLFPFNAAIAGQTTHNMPTQAAGIINPSYLGYGDQNTFFAGGVYSSAVSGFFLGSAIFSPFGGLAFSAEYLKADDKTLALSFAYGSFLTRRIATGFSFAPRYTTGDAGSAFGLGLDPSLLFDSKWHTSFTGNDGFGFYSPSLFFRTQNLSIPIGESSVLAKPSAHVGLITGLYQSAQFNAALITSTYGTGQFDKLPLLIGVQTQYRWVMFSLGYGMANYNATGNGFSLGIGANIPFSFGDTYLFYSLSLATSTRSEVHGFSAGVRLGGVDTEPPEVEFTSEGKHFSPNNDGVRDLIAFNAKVSDKSPIVFYELQIRDSKGNPVFRQKSDERIREKEFNWPLFFRSFVAPHARADIPERFTWNGRAVVEKKKAVKDNLFEEEFTDTPLADGTYSYEFRVMDEKNNESRRVTGAIIIDTKSPAAAVEISDDLISPNGDGRRDLLTVTQDTTAGDSYEAAILTAQGEKIRSYKWPENAPTRVDFDGRKDNNELADEGVYRYQLTGRDAAGNRKTATSANFYISRRVDAVSLKSSAVGLNPLSKNFSALQLAPGIEFVDGFIDGEILISRKCAPKPDEIVFRFAVNDLKVDKKKTAAQKGKGPQYTWKGEAAAGTRAPDGVYCAFFRARYDNGNAPESPPVKIVLDSTAPELEVNADLNVRQFTPDGDGENEEQAFRLFATDLSAIASYSLMISEVTMNDKGALQTNPVRSFQGQGEMPATIYWDGKTDTGGLVETLTPYEYTLTATDIYGNATTTAPRRFETGVLAIANTAGFLVRMPLTDLTDPVTDRFDLLYRLTNRYTKYKIKIEVHAASGGGIEKNLKATETVARKIFDFFADKGVATERMTYQGFGESAPIYNARSPQAVKNRRVDILLSR